MKRKIFSILFTLVLVLSFSLIPAMPAMADAPPNPTFLTYDTDNNTIREGSAVWSRDAAFAHSGADSIHFTTSGANTTDYAAVAVPTDFVLGAGTDISYWGYTAANHGAPDEIFLMFLDGSVICSTGTKAYEGEWLQWSFATASWYSVDFIGDPPSSGESVDVATRYGDTVVCIVLGVGAPEAGPVIVDAYVDQLVVDGETLLDEDTGTIEVPAPTPPYPPARIQDAVNSALPGDTINVAAGTYNVASSEAFPIIIDKALTLKGAQYGVDPTSTGARTDPAQESVIDAGTTNVSVIEISAGSVTVDGFTLKTPTGGTWPRDSGVSVQNATACHIDNNIIEDWTVYMGAGILFDGASDGTIKNNLIAKKSDWCGSQSCNGGATLLMLQNSSNNNNIEGNTVRDSDWHGICLYTESSGNLIKNNTLTGNYNVGIVIGNAGGANNRIENNVCDGNDDGGIELWNAGTGNTITGNTVTNNDQSIGGDSFPDRGFGISVYQSSTATIMDNTITGNSLGVNLEGECNDVTVKNNDINTNAVGVHFCDGAGGAWAVDYENPSTANKLNYNNIYGNTDYGLKNDSPAFNVDVTENWWGHASGPYHESSNPGGLGNSINDNVTYDPWIGQTGTTSDGANINAGETATLDLKGGETEGSEVYVDMGEGESASFSAVEETGEPTQGFTGMSGGNGIAKSIVITTDADDGDFIAVVKLHYTSQELADSGINEDDIRLYYWNTEDEEWELAVEGNIGGTIQWMGNSASWGTLESDLGRHGVDKSNNIAWAVVDHATDFGAGEGAAEVEGSFQVGPPPTVTVILSSLDMTPTVEQAVTVTVTVPEGRTLEDLTELQFKVWYDSDGGNPTENEFADLATDNPDTDTDTQTYALITWTPGGVFNIYSGGGDTTWSKGACSEPVLTGTSGSWVFRFTPGKVATETTGDATWQIAAEALNTFPTGFGYDVDGANMLFYGELFLSATVSVDWGQVPAGMEFDHPSEAKQALGANITYISNGSFNKNAKSSATWEGTSNTATLDADGQPASQYFSLKAYNADTLGSAQFLNTAGAQFNTGNITAEAGQEDTANYLWLALGDLFTEDTYSGTVTYIISPN